MNVSSNGAPNSSSKLQQVRCKIDFGDKANRKRHVFGLELNIYCEFEDLIIYEESFEFLA